MVFLLPCALDESSLSIGSVKVFTVPSVLQRYEEYHNLLFCYCVHHQFKSNRPRFIPMKYDLQTTRMYVHGNFPRVYISIRGLDNGV